MAQTLEQKRQNKRDQLISTRTKLGAAYVILATIPRTSLTEAEQTGFEAEVSEIMLHANRLSQKIKDVIQCQ